MEHPDRPAPHESVAPDWEAFYASYRKPGYVPGYEITSKLGGGRFGLVFRACKQSIGKDYAIKFLQVDDGEVRRAIVAELGQLGLFAQIDHPNLVAIEDRGEVDGIPYLVMSFAGTDTLQTRLSLRTPVPGRPPAPAVRDELLSFFLQACRGVAALHDHSLVHFDLKPANVFLKGDVARVGDFGLSKLVTHSRGSLSMGRGTPYYMAPELLQRRGDARSDVYSLGVMLFEILCGKLPFTGDNEWEVLRQHEKQAPHLPEHLSAVERAVVARCLCKDPAARFQSVHDLLAAFGAPAAVTAPARSSLEPPPPAPPQRHAAAECVPPWPVLPGDEPASNELRSRSRHGGKFPVLVMLLLVAFVGYRWVTTAQGVARARHGTAVAQAEEARRRAQVQVDSPPSVAVFTGVPGSLQAQVHEFVVTALRSARDAERRRRRVELTAPRLACAAVPDLEVCGRLVATLADAPTFSAPHATKIARNGYPVFVAAVQRLQDLDYQDACDCRRADHLTRLLAQMTDLPSLIAEAPAGDPSRADECRGRAIAAAWRELCERFAAEPAAYLAFTERDRETATVTTRGEVR